MVQEAGGVAAVSYILVNNPAMYRTNSVLT